MQMKPEPPSDRHANDTPARKPSLVDDLFAIPAEKSRKESEKRAEEDLSHPPSLVNDVFSGESFKTGKRIPVWLFVFAAIILTVSGSVLVYRSNQSVTPVWKEEPRPKLEMAEPPPVPALDPGDTKPTERAPETQAAAPSPSVKTKTVPPPLTKPAGATRQPETAKIGNLPAGTPTETKPENKPKLLREPEDLAEEQRAFDLLREKSHAARQLLDGNLEKFRFLEYQVIPKEAGLYWVDLVAAQKEAGRAEHFIWAVNPDRQTTKPLSQAARDLDR